jgi:hypothetical protein
VPSLSQPRESGSARLLQRGHLTGARSREMKRFARLQWPRVHVPGRRPGDLTEEGAASLARRKRPRYAQSLDL